MELNAKTRCDNGIRIFLLSCQNAMYDKLEGDVRVWITLCRGQLLFSTIHICVLDCRSDQCRTGSNLSRVYYASPQFNQKCKFTVSSICIRVWKHPNLTVNRATTGEGL